MGKIPRKVQTESDVQRGIRSKFKLAAAYARVAIADPATKQLYSKMASPGQTAFNLALADYFTPPTVDNIDTDGYTGVVGSKIEIEANDDFMVKSVDVKIAKADGTLIEQGPAVADGLKWTYTATQANPVLSGTKITVTAKDLPANMTALDKILA
jgi:hypothetical protein